MGDFTRRLQRVRHCHRIWRRLRCDTTAYNSTHLFAKHHRRLLLRKGSRVHDLRRRMGEAVNVWAPQSSVLGPFLWNIGYDWILRGAKLHVLTSIQTLGMNVALEETEILAFRWPRCALPPGTLIVVAGASIAVGSTMNYVEIVLNGRWEFDEQFRQLILPTTNTKTSGNSWGTWEPVINIDKCRRLFTGVLCSMPLHGPSYGRMRCVGETLRCCDDRSVS